MRQVRKLKIPDKATSSKTQNTTKSDKYFLAIPILSILFLIEISSSKNIEKTP